MSHVKSHDRIKVERALQESKEGLTIEALANLCGIAPYSVYRYVHAMRKYDQVFNVNGHRSRNPVYAWNRAKPKIEEAPPVFTTRYRELPTGTYDGADLARAPSRPGSMHAYTLPSLVSGEQVERRAPMIISSGWGEAVMKGLR